MHRRQRHDGCGRRSAGADSEHGRVDGGCGPAGATGAINHAYVTVKVCAPGSQTQCASIDHVLLDTGSSGLRLVRSVLAAGGVTLSAETDAQGRAIEECVSFGGGQTWGPVALADVTLAGETAAKLPVQVMDDTGAGAPPPADLRGQWHADQRRFRLLAPTGCSVSVSSRRIAETVRVNANHAAAALLRLHRRRGMHRREHRARRSGHEPGGDVCRRQQRHHRAVCRTCKTPMAMLSVQGELIFGIATQTDNALPATGLTVLGADAHGDFTATYNGGTTVLPALIDSGTDAYSFDDPSHRRVPPTGVFVGYYCPTVAPQSVFAVNTGVGMNNASNTVDFAIADPTTFVANAAAFIDLGGGGGSTRFTWGMPFFYGRKVYIGIDQRVAGAYTGPYYAY